MKSIPLALSLGILATSLDPVVRARRVLVRFYVADLRRASYWVSLQWR